MNAKNELAYRPLTLPSPARGEGFLLPLFSVLIGTLAPGAAARGADVIAERRARVEQMSTEEREQLSQSYDRFQHLEPEERARLRQLDADLAAAPDGDELRKVMQHYHEWLSELPAAQRMTLSALPPEERLKRIDEFRTVWGYRSRLSPQDSQAFQAWIKNHDLQRVWDDARREHRQPEVTAEQMADLRKNLSPAAQRAIEEAQKPEDLRRLLFSWIWQSRRGSGMGGFRRPSAREMSEFLKTELTESERAYLSALPPEQMERESARLWQKKHARPGDRPAPADGERHGGGDRPHPLGRPDVEAP